MKKNVKAFALAGIGAVALVGGTFAYYSSSQSFENKLDTSNYGTSVVEPFNPNDGHDWKPGVEVNKEIYATNTGDGEVWVRVKFDENWKRTTVTSIGSTTRILKNFTSETDAFNATSASKGKQVSTVDGEVSADTGSVVYKAFDNVTTTKTDANKWYKSGEYYYYTSSLAKNVSTAKLLDSITLCSDTDMGKFDDVTQYIVSATEITPIPVYPAPSGASYAWGNTAPTEADKDKYVYTAKANVLDTNAQGYANADYTLTITTEFVQATPEAATGWAWYPGKN